LGREEEGERGEGARGRGNFIPGRRYLNVGCSLLGRKAFFFFRQRLCIRYEKQFNGIMGYGYRTKREDPSTGTQRKALLDMDGIFVPDKKDALNKRPHLILTLLVLGGGGAILEARGVP
jgi:hypothetical protein